MKVPKLVVRITGNAPLLAKVYQMQKLRCNLCGEIFIADTPAGIGKEKYDAASVAMIALLKYGSGLPFNRLQQLQGSCGVPLPASTQWEIVDQVVGQFCPVYEELKRQAAQGDVIYNDDTTMKILALMQNNDRQDQSERKGIFTTGIVATVNDQKIALFYRNENGARVGDLFMSLIHTCNQAGVNPFDYLTVLQKHSADLAQHPERLLPWNYNSESSSANA